MIKNIQKICLENYSFLNKHVPLLLGSFKSHMLHNKYLFQGEYNTHTFEGAFSCGATCYLLHAKLLDNNIPTKMMIKKFGYGKYLQDHCFLHTIIMEILRTIFHTIY